MADDVERLEGLLGDDPGGTAFPALAESHRRAGAAARAEAVARAGLERRPDALAGRVALGLALLDLGRQDEARAELERVLASVPDHPLARAGLEAKAEPPPAPEVLEGEALLADPIDGGEIEAAFEDATSEPEHMVSADSVAEDAIRRVDAAADEGLCEEDAVGLPVATATVADLLESQGHDDDARAMRAEIDPAATPPDERARVLATLDRWLANLRGGRQ